MSKVSIQSEFDLPDEDLEITVRRKNGPSFTINLNDLQLIADTHFDPKIEYTQVLRKIKDSLQTLFDVKLSISQVEWLYVKKKEIELELKKNGSNGSVDSDTTEQSADSSNSIPLDQWVDETSNISSS